MSVNLSAFAGAGWQFFNDNGDPLTGGKLYTYAAGTTTPAVTYTSQDGGTAHSNPIILDAAGRVADEIWLTSDAAYKFQLKDANDVLIGTYDNIYGIVGADIPGTVNVENFTGNGTQTTFILSAPPGGVNNTQVFINGVYQFKNTYSVSGTNLTFTQAPPPAASKIEVLRFSTFSVGTLNADQVIYDPAGTGAVATTVQAKLRETVSVKDFGAVGDGVTDDTAAIQAAVTACPAAASTLYFPAGTYVLTAPITFTGKSNITLFGYGATIQCGATRIESYFNLTGTSSVYVFGFSFNAKMADMPVYTPADYDDRFNVGLYANTNTTDITVRDCRFYNLYTEGIFVRQVNLLDVQDCLFQSPVQTQDQQLQHIWFLTSAHLRVVNNRFINAANTDPAYLACGVFASGVTGSAFIDKNYFEFCGRNNQGSHKLGVIDFYFDCKNVTVTNNVALNVMSQFMRLSACDGGVIENNYVQISEFADFDSNTLSLEGGVIFSPTRNTRNNNIKILNNTFFDPFGRAAVTLLINSYDWGAWSQNILVQGNIFTDCRTAILLGNCYYGVNILDNMMFSGAGAARGGIRVEASTATTDYGTEANSYFSGLLISGNTMRCNAPGGVQINIPTLTTAYVGGTTIKNNTIEALIQTAIIGIAYNINASVKSFANISVEGNIIYKMDQGFQINNGNNVALKDNYTVGTVTFATQSGNNAYNAYDNIMQSGGASTGIATLVAGAATVSGVDCRTGDNVIVSVYRNGGTVGVPYTSSVSNGTFSIASTSATDTSQISWKVIH